MLWILKPGDKSANLDSDMMLKKVRFQVSLSFPVFLRCKILNDHIHLSLTFIQLYVVACIFQLPCVSIVKVVLFHLLTLFLMLTEIKRTFN